MKLNTRLLICIAPIVLFALSYSLKATEFKVVLKYDFDDGDMKGAEANDGGKMEIVSDDTLDGSGKALKVTNDKNYLGFAWYLRNPIKENDTTVCFAYKVVGIKGNMFLQCWSKGPGNLHGELKSTVFGNWGVAAMSMGKLTDWGGKYPNSKGLEFSNVQIYGGCGGTKSILILDNLVIFEGEDKTPPAPPKGLSYSIDDYRVKIKWQKVEDATFVARYEVYRGTTADFTPTAQNLVGQTRMLDINNDTISNFGTFYYKVRAVDASGNAGDFSEVLPAKINE